MTAETRTPDAGSGADSFGTGGRGRDVSGTVQLVVAGVVTTLVGFTSSFAVVLAGLRAVGASPEQAASGLLVLCVTMGLGSIGLALRTRDPVTMAWSLPGAALLSSAAVPGGGFADAVGAFVLAGALYLLTGLVGPLGDWVARIPASLANAMLAGVLLSLVTDPFRSLGEHPADIAPVIVVWLVLLRFARRWAVPGALVAALVVIIATGSLGGLSATQVSPHLGWTAPTFDPTTIIALGLPLYLVTMTTQNIPGVTVLRTFGYTAPLRTVLTYSGVATVATAGLGAYTINLSAVAAALAAGPTAHPDPRRRWLASVASGTSYLLLAPLAALVVAVAEAAPAGVIAAVAGLALLATFATAASTALADVAQREAGALTFVVAASGVSILGVGAAFWALVAGGVYLLVVPHVRPAT